jgi:hypothetical protein
MDIYRKLKDLNFPTGEYLVVGGVMAAHNIREAHDLDILVTPFLYQSLIAKGYKQCLCSQCVNTSRLMLKMEGVDILPNLMYGNYLGDTRKLIQTADIISGYPFIKLRELIRFKKELGRVKDIEDIRLIRTYLKSKRISRHR